MYLRKTVRIVAFCLAVLAARSSSLMAQMAGNPTAASSADDGIARVTGKASPFGTPAGVNDHNGVAEQGRPIYFSGNVLFDDGTQPNAAIRIERVCSGSAHLETHTDSKGRFSFRVSSEVANNISDADASENNLGTAHSATNGLSHAEGGAGAAALTGCELQASYPGYVSERVDLGMRHSLDDRRIGTILLHHLANVKGTTLSVTTAQAPKSARKSFEKGSQLAQLSKFQEAAEKYQRATSEYPKYAAAWFALGRMQVRLNKPDEATKSFLTAISADNHYVAPYDQLALLSGERGKWEDAAKYSQQAVDLNPVEFPASFWYNAVANYNLKNDAAAERSLRALVKIDSRHRFPQAETMLAEFATNRGDPDEAAVHLKAYLAAAPYAENIDQVKSELARIEQARGTQAKSAPSPVR